MIIKCFKCKTLHSLLLLFVKANSYDKNLGHNFICHTSKFTSSTFWEFLVIGAATASAVARSPHSDIIKIIKSSNWIYNLFIIVLIIINKLNMFLNFCRRNHKSTNLEYIAPYKSDYIL